MKTEYTFRRGFESEYVMGTIYFSNSSHLVSRISSPSWSRPWPGTIKINVDAAVFDNSKHIGVDVVVRDDRGIAIVAFAFKINGIFSPFLAELMAVRQGILVARQYQWPSIILETDALKVVNSIFYFSPLASEAPLCFL